jgi:hypothetical protein
MGVTNLHSSSALHINYHFILTILTKMNKFKTPTYWKFWENWDLTVVLICILLITSKTEFLLFIHILVSSCVCCWVISFAHFPIAYSNFLSYWFVRIPFTCWILFIWLYEYQLSSLSVAGIFTLTILKCKNLYKTKATTKSTISHHLLCSCCFHDLLKKSFFSLRLYIVLYFSHTNLICSRLEN